MRSLLQSEAQLIELVSGVRMRLKPNFSSVYAENPGGDFGVTKDHPRRVFFVLFRRRGNEKRVSEFA